MATASGGSQPLRILVVDDDEDLRLLLRLVLEGSERFEVIGEAADAPAALELAPRLRPDAVVLDLGLPGLSGLQVLPELCRLVPAARVVVFSGQSGDQGAALALGAASYVLKDGDVGPLIAALDAATPGGFAEASMPLRADGKACREARVFVARMCAEWGCEELVDVAELVASELVGNLVVHARTEGALTLRLWDDAIRIEVTDRSEKMPAPQESQASSESGRGLLIVAALSLAWGVAPVTGGKGVWADLPRTGDPVSAP